MNTLNIIILLFDCGDNVLQGIVITSVITYMDVNCNYTSGRWNSTAAWLE